MCIRDRAVGDIVREYERRHGNDYKYFAEENSIQLNDTHPVFAIPELIRVLKEKGVSYLSALKIAKQVFNYTNHKMCIRDRIIESCEFG